MNTPNLPTANFTSNYPTTYGTVTKVAFPCMNLPGLSSRWALINCEEWDSPSLCRDSPVPQMGGPDPPRVWH